MELISEEMKLKCSPKKKIKCSKPIKKLILLDDSEENVNECSDESNAVYTKRHLNLKFSETRLNAQSKHGLSYGNSNGAHEDVFDDNQSSQRTTFDNKSKNNEEINELLDLVKDIREKSFNTSLCQNSDCIDLNDTNDTNDMNDTNGMIDTTDSTACVSHNTRSKKGNKTAVKKKSKRNNKRNNKKQSIGVNNEQQMFDKLDVMECMEGIETFEEIQEIEVKNDSMTDSDDVQKYINSRSIEIKVKYKAGVAKFEMKQNDHFLTIMSLIADTFGEEVSHLFLTLDGSIINAESTPQSVGLKVTDIIICHKRNTNKSSNETQMKDPNILTFKLRDSSKVIQTVNVSKFDKFSKIMDKYSEMKGLSITQFRLEFDGERIDGNQKVGDFDIEDDSQIDVIAL